MSHASGRGMTLAQWSEKHGVKVEKERNLSTFVYVDENDPARREAYSLSDYVVSSSCGPILRLLPKPPKGFGTRS